MDQFRFVPVRPADPDRLWIWKEAVYVDENCRTWMPIIIKVQPREPWAGPASRGASAPRGPGAQRSLSCPAG